MRKLLFLLLCTVSMYGQAEFDAGIQITGGQTNTSTSNKLLSQEANGVVNYIPALSLPLSTANISALQKKADLSTGLIKNGLITINADPTKYDISAGIGIISNFDDPENPISTLISFPAFTAITPTYLNTGNITYIAINSSSAIVMQASPFTSIQRRDLIILGAVIHSNLTSINVVNNISAPTNADTNQLHDFMEAIGALNITGNKYTANGANMQLNKSAGTIFKFGVNFANDWKSPHRLSQASGTALTFRYRTQNGTEGSDRINLDPSLYDLNNVYTSVPNNKFVIETIVTFQTGLTRILKGQNYYDDLASAKAAIFTRQFVVEPNSLENGIIRGYVIMRNTTTSLQNVSDAEILEAQKFGGVASGGVALTFANIVAALGYTPANIVSPTFTGILTAPEVLVSNATANTLAYFNPFKQVSTLPTSSYPSLGEIAHVKGVTSAIQTQLNTKAPLASPTFTGVPTVPTATPGTNTTQIATTAFVTDAVGSGILEFNSTDRTVWNNGKSNIESNTSFGDLTLRGVTTGTSATAMGYQAMYVNTTGVENTGIGAYAMRSNAGGSANTAVGAYSLWSNTSGNNNIAIGDYAMYNNTTGSGNVLIGQNSFNLTSSDANEIVIGFNNTGAGSNTVTLGNSSITTTRLRGAVQGGSFVKDGGTASQFLKADGSSDGTAYVAGTGTVNYVPKLTGTGTQGNSQIFDNGTNVGIGTTAPISLLDLKKDSYEHLIFDRSGNVNSPTLFSMGITYDTPNNEYLRIGYRSAGVGLSNLILSKTGNVGIGTTTPVGALNVFTGNALSLDILNQQAGSISFSNGGTSEAPIISGKSNNNIGMSFISATNNINSAADMRFDARENDNTDFSTLTSTAFSFSRMNVPLMQISRTGNVTIGSGSLSVNGVIKLKGYTVATLPAGVQGDTAFVTDATTPTYLGTLTGGGSVVCPVLYNGTIWVSH